MNFSLSPDVALIFMLIFVRVGTMTMLMPGIGEAAIPSRIRLGFALALTLILYPMLASGYATAPQTLPGLGGALIVEFAVGFAIGFSARLVISALQIAGASIAMQLGLSFAEGVDPTQSQNSAILGNFLTVTAVAMIFATNLHYLAIGGIVDSFRIFPPGLVPPAADFSMMAIALIGEAFRVGVQISAPFVLFGLIFQLGLGLLSRLMPQIQIFFIAMPASIAVGLLLVMLLLGAMMTWYLNHFETALGRFIAQ